MPNVPKGNETRFKGLPMEILVPKDDAVSRTIHEAYLRCWGYVGRLE